ncbi:hypothetical protein MNBD_NITROSPINAE01-1547 [hydrothermal vent metagenome]|uniref:Uncharacterized protein n=1 Tax=hydrothermal vent metagenome TaxID=652676 RepID=A0A3B1CNY4_9ZZZZ
MMKFLTRFCFCLFVGGYFFAGSPAFATDECTENCEKAGDADWKEKWDKCMMQERAECMGNCVQFVGLPAYECAISRCNEDRQTNQRDWKKACKKKLGDAPEKCKNNCG